MDGVFFSGESGSVKDRSIDDDLGSGGQGNSDLPIKERLPTTCRADIWLRNGNATAVRQS